MTLLRLGIESGLDDNSRTININTSENKPIKEKLHADSRESTWPVLPQ